MEQFFQTREQNKLQAIQCIKQLKDHECTLKKAYWQLNLLGNGTYIVPIDHNREVKY